MNFHKFIHRFCAGLILTIAAACSGPETAPRDAGTAGDQGLDGLADTQPVPTAEDGERCATHTAGEEECLSAGCTVWERGELWLEEADGKCKLVEQSAPMCWMNTSGESERSDLATSYYRVREDGREEVVVLGADRGQIIGWSLCSRHPDGDCACPAPDDA